MRDIFIRKSIDNLIAESNESKHSLKKVLGPLNLTMIGVGAIVGAGIFILTGQAAAQYGGPAIIISFIISAIGCAFTGLCYAEFASMIPIAGSAYTYAYATLGEFIAWIIGWDLILEYLFGSSAVAVGWSGYVVSFLKDFGIKIPYVLSSAPFAYDAIKGWYLTGAIINLPAVLIIMVIVSILITGIRESANFNNLIVFIKITVIILFIVFGISYINYDNYKPFIPPNTGSFGHYGISGIIRGAGVVFFAYIGFDTVSTTAQEAKNPQKDMPIGILMSLVISTVLYVLVAFVLTGIVKYDKLNVADPIAAGIDAAGSGLIWLRPFIKIGAIAGLSSVILVLLLGQQRIFYSMAIDGLLPEFFSKVHPKFKTPYITTILTGTIAALLAGFLPMLILGEMVSIGTLLAFTLVSIGVWVLRKKEPLRERAFKTPAVGFVSMMGAGISIVEMVFLPFTTWIRLIVWLLIGLTIYFSYSYKHSVIRKNAVI